MDILSAVLDVFSEVGTWLTGALSDMTGIFWDATNNQLTLLGVLAVVGLGFAVIFLVIGIIQNFLHFRG